MSLVQNLSVQESTDVSERFLSHLTSGFLPTLRPTFQNLCTSPPYFALHGLTSTPQGVQATVPVDYARHPELTPISAAEAGRHLAILGSCAVNQIQDTPIYCLAQRAILHLNPWHLSSAPPSSSPRFRAVAKATAVAPKIYHAQADLLDASHTAIFSLDVHFMAIPKRVFERLFAHRHILSIGSPIENPYRHPIWVEPRVMQADFFQGVLGPILPTQCWGHFHNFPALPVAILMANLCHSAGLLLQHIVGEDCRYAVSLAQVHAQNLAFAGDILDISVRYLGRDGNDFRFSCYATHAETSIGSLDLVLTCQ